MFERICAMLLFASQKSSTTAAEKDCGIAWFLCFWKIYHLFSTKKTLFCGSENGKNQIMLAIMSAIANCRRELKKLLMLMQPTLPIVYYNFADCTWTGN